MALPRFPPKLFPDSGRIFGFPVWPSEGLTDSTWIQVGFATLVSATASSHWFPGDGLYKISLNLFAGLKQ